MPFGKWGWASAAVVCAVALALLLDLGLRHALGLGNPPLLQADSDIEYYYVPNRHYVRFGNHISYNSWSMRSRQFPRTKERKEEVRVLVLGDSVVNGGAPTDQGELATEILRARLTDALGREVQVGNVSAGSWGPENLLAYVERFGTFDADVAIVVLSSHDATDVIRGGAHLPTPYDGPFGATTELVEVYLPRYLPTVSDAPPRETPPVTGPEAQIAIAAFRHLLRLLKQDVSHVVLMLHHEVDELEGPVSGLAVLRENSESLGVPVVDLGSRFKAALASGQRPYRDNVHPSSAGQRLLADAFTEYVTSVLTSPGP